MRVESVTGEVRRIRNVNCMAAGSSEMSADYSEGCENDLPQDHHHSWDPAEPKEMEPKLHSQGDLSIEDGGWPVGLRRSSPACKLEFGRVHPQCPETKTIHVTYRPQ